AGITCYAVNGVCHQAANRILYHAGITVLGARGYGVSESLYGTYGRTPRWLLSRRCPAPFDQHPGITGDFPECLPAGIQAGGPARDYNEREHERERRYVQRVAGEYQKLSLQRLQSREWGDELVQFMATLFEYKIEYNLGFSAKDRVFHRLMDIRRNIESAQIEIESGYAEGALSTADFYAASDRVTASMQDQVAEILDDDQYEKLFDAKRGDIITLVDPAITGQAPRSGDLEPEGGR
ncbi:MAG TPA: hypothetical protein VIC61_03895, partial [Gammaproteobacteria bacterium]